MYFNCNILLVVIMAGLAELKNTALLSFLMNELIWYGISFMTSPTFSLLSLSI